MSRDNTTPSLLCKVVKPLFLYKFIFTTLGATSTLINFTKRHINPHIGLKVGGLGLLSKIISVQLIKAHGAL